MFLTINHSIEPQENQPPVAASATLRSCSLAVPTQSPCREHTSSSSALVTELTAVHPLGRATWASRLPPFPPLQAGLDVCAPRPMMPYHSISHPIRTAGTAASPLEGELLGARWLPPSRVPPGSRQARQPRVGAASMLPL